MIDFPTWGSGKGTENPQGIWFWRPVGFENRTSSGLGKQTLGGHKQNLVHTRSQEKETDPDLPVGVQESWVEEWVNSGLLHSQGTEYNSACTSPSEGGRHYLHYPYHSLASGQTTGGEHSPTQQRKIGLKIYWAWLHPSEQDPVSPTVSLSHQEASISLLSLSIRVKITIIENQPNWSHGSQPCLTQWNYEPCHIGPPKMDGSWWRVLTKPGPLETGMANHFNILALRTPWTVWKGKKIGHWKMNSPGQ